MHGQYWKHIFLLFFQKRCKFLQNLRKLIPNLAKDEEHVEKSHAKAADKCEIQETEILVDVQYLLVLSVNWSWFLFANYKVLFLKTNN